MKNLLKNLFSIPADEPAIALVLLFSVTLAAGLLIGIVWLAALVAYQKSLIDWMLQHLVVR